MFDFEPLGALSGPGAPDPDLLGFVLGLNVRTAWKVVTCVREWSRVFKQERTINSPNPYCCKSVWTCPEKNHYISLLKMNERTPRTRGNFFAPVGEKRKPPTFALTTEIDRAIDLSCRACGAMAMGAGLGFPVGVSAPLRFPPPTSDHKFTETVFLPIRPS